MKKVFCALYELKPIGSFSGLHKESEGLLLKFTEKENTTYSLYHPIESLGDLPLKKFVSGDLKTKKLLQKAFEISVGHQDVSKALDQEVSCYFSASSLDFVKNYNQVVFDQGFKDVKIKLKSLKDLEPNFDILKELPFQYIFDFNGREAWSSFEKLSGEQKDFFQNRLLYVEDPCHAVEEDLFFKLASDFIDYGAKADFHILKPTGLNHQNELTAPEKTVVTSYWDHPLGQLIGAYWAFKNQISNKAGLYTHMYFEPNNYSLCFEAEAKISLDTLPNFLKLLETEDWKFFDEL